MIKNDTTEVAHLNQVANEFDSLLEGIQIIDFDWRFVYVNDTLCKQVNATKKELIGQNFRDKFPGIEKTPVFKALKECMSNRKVQRLQNEHRHNETTKRWYELIIKPVKLGICIISLDITHHKKTEAKAQQMSKLYAFISQVNQNIVRIKEEEVLFKNACQLAIEFGKFKMAWIGMFDKDKGKITLVEQSGSDLVEIAEFSTTTSDYSQKKVLKTGKHFICNDIKNEIELDNWKPFIEKHCISSCIILPLRKSGEIIGTLNLYSSEIPFFDQEEITLLIEVSKDISYALDRFEKEKQQVQNEEIILVNENRFRALIEHNNDVIALSNKEGRFIYASPNFTKVLGYETDDYLTISAYDIIHAADLKEFHLKVKHILRGEGRSFDLQLLLKHKSGKWIWCEGKITNMTHLNSVNAIVINFRDISEKKKIEEKLLKSETFSRNILNSLSAHIAVINKNGKIIAVNDAWNRFAIENSHTTLEHTGLGSNYFSVCKKSFLAGDETANTVLLGLKEVMSKTEKSFYYEYPCDSPKKERWFAMLATPFDGNEDLVVIGHQNITQRKKDEEIVLQKNKELEKTNFELDRFVYSVSHDLRSPLTSVLGLLSFIQEDSKEPETQLHTRMIRDSVNRLDEFIKNILSYSRNNRMPLEIEKVPLQKTTDEIVKSLSYSKEAENISFEVTIDEECHFYSDKQSYTTIIENLISNAIKFQDNNKTQQHIKIKATSKADYLKLKVSDNGIGIADENHAKIFEMFKRISGDVPGSGIGLYIVKEIITKIEGTIAVKSIMGKGTAFTIVLKNLKPC